MDGERGVGAAVLFCFRWVFHIRAVKVTLIGSGPGYGRGLFPRSAGPCFWGWWKNEWVGCKNLESDKIPLVNPLKILSDFAKAQMQK